MADKHGDGVLSLIGSGTVVEGKIITEGSVRVDGRLVGDIASKANVTVGPSGVVEGTIQGANVSLAGNVNGTITALEKIVLETKSVMRGDIRAQRLVVDEGAIFDGTCTMSGDLAGKPGARMIPGREPAKELPGGEQAPEKRR